MIVWKQTQTKRFGVYLLLLTNLVAGIPVGLSYAQAPRGQAYEPELPAASNDYTPGPDSRRQPNVPAGKLFSFTLENSKIYPGTTRQITVYIPAQYAPGKPACLYIGLDNLAFEAPTVFDNLIAQRAMPVTIAVGVSPGEVASHTPPEDPRFDRSLEFDTMDDRLARFLIEEVIPEVQRHKTPAGEPIVLSTDPNDHAIGGGSTGGIAAFNAAWQRPDVFRRVFVAIGTFVGMRGGERFYVQVRKTEPKPLRIFQTDGAYDEWPGGPEIGDWWMSNLTMNRALEFAGYDVKHVWGTGNHNGNQATALFPDAMRWLWRDYPAPIVAPKPGNPRLAEIAVPDQGWQLTSQALPCPGRAGLTIGLDGRIASEGIQTGIGAPAGGCDPTGDEGVAAFGPDGSQYIVLAAGGIAITSPAGKEKRTISPALHFSALTVDERGDIYATTISGSKGGELWLIRPDGASTKLDDGILGASGVALSPDRLWLLVSQEFGHQALNYRVNADGHVDSREPLYELYVPDNAEDSGARGIAVDQNGWAYIATRMGIQVCDRNGRVTIILPLPRNERATAVAFGGSDFRTLYVATEDGKLYKRVLKVAGVPSFAPRIQLPKWGAG